MEGQHQLGTDAIIDSAHNITIMALDIWSSSPIITCNSRVGLWFSHSTSITITSIAINNCSNDYNTAGTLNFYNISSVVLDNINVTNSNSRGIVMNNVGISEIHKCLFNSNGNGGIEMVDVHIIIIAKCSFSHNTAKYGYGEGGGFKIKASSLCPILSLIHSNFTNNTALYGGGLLIDIQCGNITVSNSHFSYNTVQRLGGGIRVRLCNSTHHPNFTFIQSTFEYNTVLGKDVLPGEPAAGGGVYMYLTDIKPTTTIIVIECNFNGNNGYTYGGAFAINRDDSSRTGPADQFLINAIKKYSLFQSNNAIGTSSIHIVYGYSNTTISNCKFFNNFCSYYCFYSHPAVVMFQRLSSEFKGILSNAIINNCIFFKNKETAVGSHDGNVMPTLTVANTIFDGQIIAINVVLDEITRITNVTVTSSSSIAMILQCTHSVSPSRAHLILSDLKIHGNQGTGILTDCNVNFRGSNIIANNTAGLDGGGMAMYGTGMLYVDPNGNVLFSNNTAVRYGGGVYALELRLSSFFYHICTITYISYARNIYFESNKAAAGDNFYGGRFYLCDLSGATVVPNRSVSVAPNRSNTVIALPKVIPTSWNQTSVCTSKPLSVISSDPIAVCLCDNDTVDCSSMSNVKQVHSGEPFNVSIALVGLGGGVNSGSFIGTASSGLVISGASDNLIATKSCKTFVYTPKLQVAHSNNDHFYTLDILNSIIPDGYLNITLSILPCPPGLVLDTTTRSCVCDGVLNQKMPGIKCNVSWMPHPIQYSENNWIGYYQPFNCTIAHSGCPFDYCISSNAKFSLNESDIQCNYNRSGILCGQCKPGLSLMLGSNKCSQCSNDSLALIPVFAISGVLLVILLIALNLTVSVGSINGLLFYTNIVKLNESTFFPQGGIPVISQFLAWLNLDWGIETCFCDGLDSFWKAMLQYLFPVYLWFLVIVIIVACRHSFRVSRLCGHNAVPVLATLILMSYTKVLRTVTKSLMINTLECGDTKWNVWNIDGNIPYLSGKHIVLFSISLVFLVTGLIYTGLVFSSQWLQRYSGKCCKSTRDPVVMLKPFIDAYTGPYKDKYRFWMGLGLIVHVLLTVTFTFTSEKSSIFNNNFFIALSLILTGIIGGRVYRNKYNTIIETSSHVNLFILALVAIPLSINDSDGKLSMAIIISVTLEMLTFLVIIIVHCHLAMKALFKRRYKIRKNNRRDYARKCMYGSTFDELPSPIQKRETLIYYDN